MKDSDKFAARAITLCVLALFIVGIVILHDNSIRDAVKRDTEISYFLQVNNDMTATEKYELALSISEDGYDHMSSMWFKPVKDKWIKNNAFELTWF